MYSQQPRALKFCSELKDPRTRTSIVRKIKDEIISATRVSLFDENYSIVKTCVNHMIKIVEKV